MTWLRVHRRSAIIVALTLLVPAYFYLAMLFKLLALRGEYADGVQDLRPRIARLEGLIENTEALRSAAGQVGQRLEDLGYPLTQDATAVAAELQTDVRRVLAEAGLAVRNSQVLQSRTEDNFDLVGLKVTANGGLPSLDAALEGIAAFRPMLLVESLDVFPSRTRSPRSKPGDQELTVVIELLALRRLQ